MLKISQKNTLSSLKPPSIYKPLKPSFIPPKLTLEHEKNSSPPSLNAIKSEVITLSLPQPISKPESLKTAKEVSSKSYLGTLKEFNTINNSKEFDSKEIEILKINIPDPDAIIKDSIQPKMNIQSEERMNFSLKKNPSPPRRHSLKGISFLSRFDNLLNKSNINTDKNKKNEEINSPLSLKSSTSDISTPKASKEKLENPLKYNRMSPKTKSFNPSGKSEYKYVYEKGLKMLKKDNQGFNQLKQNKDLYFNLKKDNTFELLLPLKSI